MLGSPRTHCTHISSFAIIAFAAGIMGCHRGWETGSPSSSQSGMGQRPPDEPVELSQDLPPQVLLLLEKHFSGYVLPLSTSPLQQATTHEKPNSLSKKDVKQPYTKLSGKPLAEAVLNGDIESVRRLLESGHPVDETYLGLSGLHLAAKHGQADLCKLLLDAGLDINGISKEESSHHITPLQRAILSRSVETVKLLLAHGGKLLPNDDSGSPAPLPLSLAISSGSIEMLNFFLDEGEVANDGAFLHAAINNLQADSLRRKVIERLIAAGAADNVKVGTPDLFVPAIATGDMELLKILEAKLTVAFGEPHLRAAVQSGNVELCRYILSKRVRAQPNPAVSQELLRMAMVDHRSPELVDLVIEAGEKKQYCVQSEACTSYCNRRDFAHPLYHAVLKNDLGFCRYLIREFSSDPNLWGSLIYDPYEYEDDIEYFQQHNTILFAAVFDDNADALKLLLKYTQSSGKPPIVDINAKNHVGHTVLHEAVNCGAARCVQLLLAAGADPTVTRNDGCTPLHLAMQHFIAAHNYEHKPLPTMSNMFPMLAAAMMSRGDAEWVHRRNAAGESILHRHAHAGNAWICQKLIELGANVNAVDEGGRTPLNLALRGIPDYINDDAVKARYIATCITLLDQGTDITQTETPYYLHYLCEAASKNLYEVYDELLNRNAKPNLEQNAGSLMCSAAKFDRPDRIMQLLDWGTDINARDDVEHSTALHQAARFHHLETCELLIARGADVNARDKRGQTPIFELFGQWAIHARIHHYEDTQEKAFPLLTLLLKHGADPDVKANSTTQTDFSGTVLEIFKHMPQSFRDTLHAQSTPSEHREQEPEA